MKILVIDDQEAIRGTLRDILEVHGHEVIEAEDGVVGVKMAAQKPDFIFCDVDMPNLNGHGVLAAVKEMPEVRDVPFVFLTANADRQQQREGMTLGADDYITKPFTLSDITGAIAARTQRQKGVREKIQELTRRHQREVSAHWSHELLTPLNAILGSLELLELDADTIDRKDLKEMLALIRAGAVRQERLSRKLIRYFSLEQQRMDPAKARPGRCAADVAVKAAASEAAQEHQRGRDVTVAAEAATVGVSDDGLRYAVAEIVNNAVTWSKPGTAVQVTGRNRQDRYRIEIADEGPGMTAEQRAQVGPFVQFDRQRREQQGLGLGLEIARATARLAGGDLSLEPGRGDRGLKVIFDLPVVG